MKLLFDLFPVILFFAAFKAGQSYDVQFADALSRVFGSGITPEQAPVLAATVIAILASIVQVGFVYLRGKKPEPMLWVSLVLIVVFGSLTLWLRNEIFIKWKPTILYWVFGAVLAFGTATGRNFLQKLLGAKVEMPARAWDRMQKAWTGFFFITGAVNLAVAYLMSTEAWVNFKLFGILGLTLVFTFAVGLWIARECGDFAGEDDSAK